MPSYQNDKFIQDMSAFNKKALSNMDAVVRKVVIDIGTRVVLRSPVGDPTHWASPAPKGYTGGHFRANWQYSLGEPAAGIVPGFDPGGRNAIARIAQAIPAAAGGKVHFISNNLPYAMRLETGWSRQAPAGMVGITVREFQGIVARVTKEVNR